MISTSEASLARQLAASRRLHRCPACYDFFDGHATGAENAAVHEHHGHGHDFALGHFLLEGAAFDHRGLDLGLRMAISDSA